MKAYVKSYEMILATTILLSLLIFSTASLLRYKTYGSQNPNDLSRPFTASLDYLSKKGYLQRILVQRKWDALKELVDDMTLPYGINYDLNVYIIVENDTTTTYELVFHHVSGSSSKTKSGSYVIFYVPPTPRDISESYLLVIRLVR